MSELYCVIKKSLLLQGHGQFERRWLADNFVAGGGEKTVARSNDRVADFQCMLSYLDRKGQGQKCKLAISTQIR